MPSPRAVAVEHLTRIERDAAFVARLDAGLDDPRDARFVSDIVAGVTRLRRWLDFQIAWFYHGDIDRLEDVVRQILRVALYEVLERHTPPHAAVSEAVEAARTASGEGAAGLTNAVLRAALRAIETGRLPKPETGKPVRDLAIRHSHPTWLVRRWMARFGEEETLALLQTNNERPAHGLRVNTGKVSVEAFADRLEALGVEWRPSVYLEDFLVVEQLQPVMRAGLIDEGWCAVQDEAAGIVVRVFDPKPGESILDAAAAPGGKALYAATLMQNEGRIVAVDVHPARTDLVRRAARRQGITIVDALAVDLRAFETGVPFDRVLLDAPCSGLGVLARRADLRWRVTPERIAELTSLQGELLDAAAGLVRPGGLLVYATCTIAPEENAQRVENFLARHPEYSLEPARGTPLSMQTPEGFYEALPQRHGTDGGFGARLRRNTETGLGREEAGV